MLYKTSQFPQSGPERQSTVHSAIPDLVSSSPCSYRPCLKPPGFLFLGLFLAMFPGTCSTIHVPYCWLCLTMPMPRPLVCLPVTCGPTPGLCAPAHVRAPVLYPCSCAVSANELLAMSLVSVLLYALLSSTFLVSWNIG